MVRFHFDHGLVGFDVEEDLPLLDPVSRFHMPLDDGSFLHALSRLRHQDWNNLTLWTDRLNRFRFCRDRLRGGMG
jgi:hypothetical protein